jgi:hypothetical protein
MACRSRHYALLVAPALVAGVGACGQILGVDGLRGPPPVDAGADGGDVDEGVPESTPSIDASVGARDASASDRDGQSGSPDPGPGLSVDACSDGPDGATDAGPGNAGVYAFQPKGANMICAESIAAGDDTAALVDGVAPNGTWFVGCDYPNRDSVIYELQDDYTSGHTPSAGSTMGRNLAMGPGPSGHAWIVDQEGLVYEWTGTAFTVRALPAGVSAIPSEQFVGNWQSTLAVDRNNNVWIISDVRGEGGNYYAYYYSSSAGTWTARTDIYGTQIALAPDSATVVWTLVTGQLGTGTPTEWDLSQASVSPRTHNQCATDIAVGPKNTPWILDCNVGESASNGSSGLRVMLKTSAGGFAPIVDATGGFFYAASLGMSSATGVPWYLDSYGNVFSGTLISAP